jgi:choline dehydrogenase-like flavoprotein
VLPGVGDHLQEHISFGVVFQVLAVDTLAKIASPLVLLWHLLLFLLYKTGFFACMSVRNAIWVRSGAIDDTTMTVKQGGDDEKHDIMDASRPENIPDIEYLLVPASSDFKVTKGIGYHSLMCVLTQPFTRGKVSLASTDPLAAPVVRHPIMADKRDFAVARKAVRFAMRYIGAIRETRYPFAAVWDSAPGVQEGSMEGTWQDPTDDEIDTFIKSKVKAIYHPTSTCRIGPEADGGVLGQDLKVHGFQNLRVADASVFPKITAAHTMAPTLMVAERCADLIAAEWAARKAK